MSFSKKGEDPRRKAVEGYYSARRKAPIIVNIPIPIANVVGQSVPELGSAACGVAVGAAAMSWDVAVGVAVGQVQPD